jgi:hypothetical protein
MDDFPFMGFAFLQRHSSTMYVLEFLGYALFGATLFSYNSDDRFQGHILMVGLVAGFLVSLSSTIIGEVGFVSVSRFATCVTGALAVSACGHWAWWMCFGKRGEEKVESSGEVKEIRKVEGV